MADDIIDLSRAIERRAGGDAPTGTMALWGAEGERSRFALPLWRIVHLAGANRGVIFWRAASGGAEPRPFVVLDVGRDPARLTLPAAAGTCGGSDAPQMHDLGRDGVVICLGDRDGRVWGVLADGGVSQSALSSRQREDILFLCGECAGLLFLRDFADDVDD
jgi:hypothetical protein